MADTPAIPKDIDVACPADPEIKHLSEKLDHGFKQIDDHLAQMDQIVKQVNEQLSKRVESSTAGGGGSGGGYKYAAYLDHYNSFLLGSVS